MCGEIKSAREFYKEKRVHDGLTARCKNCTREAANTSYQNRREIVLASHKEKYCAKKNRASALMKNYGMTIEEWNEMFASQNYRCAICGSKDPLNTAKNFVVDHCHSLGHVRGILCSPCNAMLGFAHDDPNVLWDAMTYLLSRPVGETVEERKKRHGYKGNDKSEKLR
jgi:hypothetical protein